LGYFKDGGTDSWGCGHDNSCGSGFGAGNAVGVDVVVLCQRYRLHVCSSINIGSVAERVIFFFFLGREDSDGSNIICVAMGCQRKNYIY
jgi:hypothetical protein